jgi:hypothetical protein
MISIQGGSHFAVYDPLTDRPIRCLISEDKVEDVQKLFRKRVVVSGKIRYRKTGEPISVEVEDVQGLPDRKTLPSAEDVYGIF